MLRTYNTTTRSFGAIVFIAAASALIAIYFLPFSMPTPTYFQDAQALVKGEKVNFGFLPIGYTSFLYACLKPFGTKGIFWAQAFLYFLTIFSSYLILGKLKVRRRLIFISCLIIALHPYLIFNIKRIVDNTLTVPLMVLLTVLIVWLQDRRIELFVSAVWGLVVGYLVLARPNCLLLFLLIIYAYSQSPFFQSYRYRVTSLLLFFFFSTIIMVGLSTFIAGKPLILTDNGCYNLFLGANPRTYESLINHYNAEPLFGKALKDLNLTEEEITSEQYCSLAIDYIRHNPLVYTKLFFVKLFNLFRPDYRKVGSSNTISSATVLFIVQTLLALPFFAWLAVRLISVKLLTLSDKTMMIPVSLLYILPFLVLASDPRYRLPLDILLIIDTFYCLDCYLNSKSAGDFKESR